MTAPKDQWLDQEAGPVVRPYAITKGRTVPTDGTSVGLIDVVVAAGEPAAARPPAGPRAPADPGPVPRPVTVVDLASDIDLPVGVVRVLLSDLSQHGMIRVLATPGGRSPMSVY